MPVGGVQKKPVQKFRKSLSKISVLKCCLNKNVKQRNIGSAASLKRFYLFFI